MQMLAVDRRIPKLSLVHRQSVDALDLDAKLVCGLTRMAVPNQTLPVSRPAATALASRTRYKVIAFAISQSKGDISMPIHGPSHAVGEGTRHPNPRLLAVSSVDPAAPISRQRRFFPPPAPP